MAQNAISLSDELQHFAEAEVEAGRFASVEDVVRHALAEFQKLESLREDFRDARAEFARGEGIELTSEGLLAHMRGRGSEGPATPSY